MAIHTTQIMNPQPEKNSSVNQSIRAATCRLSVGSAKAASAANAGRPSSKVRSDALLSRVAGKVTSMNQTGNIRCRLGRVLKSCRRQRHTVHRARGQAGQVNHVSSSR